MASDRWKYRDDYNIVLVWQAKVTDAALPFEARWTEAALRRTDPNLYARFQQQRQLFNVALEGGTLEEVATHGGAMARAYIAAFTAMQVAGAPDDAYQLGRAPHGLTIAIGSKACCARVQELYGDGVQWFSPDEIAILVEMDQRFKTLADVKRLFPGAEIKG